ncbi:Cyclin-dependent protein kinase inhibitor SMR4 [Senna tora]|uniref:Cyclin-dependent protein kinase inhibitor SMR4 n=1 Tax=Senna tora TaxID=362788 RepID=A0A834XHZ2_9FABA|nr:Cyclin-dependent protein kinase inhibitor SMR4 [Senna tora]
MSGEINIGPSGENALKHSLEVALMASMDRSGMREWEEECKTPRHIQNQIPAMILCPPPPRKKPVGAGKRREPPRDGYFQPPDLDSLFGIPARKEAFA